MKILHSELHPISDKWYSLGIQLQVPVGILRCIRRENHGMSECLLEMLISWLKRTNPPPTWEALAEALKGPPVEEGHVAQHLRDKYCPGREETVAHVYPIPGASPTLPGNIKLWYRRVMYPQCIQGSVECVSSAHVLGRSE